MARYRRLAGLFAFLSAILGIYILVEDFIIGFPERLLWWAIDIQAPIPHVYALIGFVIIDIIAGILVFASKTAAGVTLASIWGLLQVLAMALDPLSASYFEITVEEFAAYLFSIPGFDGRILTEALLFVTGLMARGEYRRAG